MLPSTSLPSIAFSPHGLFTVAGSVVGAAVLLHILLYLYDRQGIKRYPGPFLARLSHTWLAWIAVQGKVNVAVHEAHKKYGKFVRIAPNQVSIADPSAIATIYGHSFGHGTPNKSSLYTAFNQFPGAESIFSTRSREVHARKRKLIAHTFSLKSVTDFEPVVRKYNKQLMQHWDRMSAAAAKGESGTVGESEWKARDGYAFLDCLLWFNFQVFDIIGDLVFDGPFGMTSTGRDTVQIVKSRKATIDSYGLEGAKLDYATIPAVKTINERSKFAISIAVLPTWWRPLVKRLPWYHGKGKAMEDIATLAVTAVSRRLKSTEVRSDNILSKLLDATDENGEKMGGMELSGEAMTLLVAGTDTTSNSSAVITFYLAGNQEAQKKLQRELDDALGPPSAESLEESEFGSGSYDQLKDLPYLKDAIDEGLRLYSTVGFGLPRDVPEDGLTICGERFAPGTVVSVPSYTVHRDKAIWGEDAEKYVPERWSRGDRAAMQKAFAPFSIGPRACLGRNLATMEMTVFLGNLFHRYELVAEGPNSELNVSDAFLRKPLDCMVGVRRRARV
ncbi:cytochrome P450 monooxygenase pc-bph [Irpex rosettiformis]|uniref:Cytochrome P450 monooxygenase pc-bph n=1 Tax=Irpex rosettiformis TaxID=378272 RepID=A0ACB8TXZ5_9APHY|nr:cytochrome P450 monooxygenase pc-bph [Irpex rosettiformis]